ncbi:unnamed protein product [Urochloa humidicola]
MSTVEEKLDVVINEVKTLQIDQLKLTTKVDGINTWTLKATKTSEELSDTIQSLTSRIATLESISASSSTKAPWREEEGRANGHCDDQLHQGVDPGSLTLDSALVKGEQQQLKPIISDIELPEANWRHRNMGNSHSDYKLPKIDFPKFTGEHPRLWKE